MWALRAGKFLKHVLPPEVGRERICTRGSGLPIRLRHILKSSLSCAMTAHQQVQKLNSHKDKEKAYKYLNPLLCVLFFQDLKFMPLPGSVMTMFRSRTCFQVMQAGLLKHKCTLGPDRQRFGLYFSCSTCSCSGPGCTTHCTIAGQEVGSLCPSSTEIF